MAHCEIQKFKNSKMQEIGNHKDQRKALRQMRGCRRAAAATG